MSDYRTVFKRVCAYTSMYVHPATYSAASSFVAGYDTALDGGVLVGFREWLITRLKLGNNLAWPALVLQAAFPDAANPMDIVHSSPKHERLAIDTLFQLFDGVRRDAGPAVGWSAENLFRVRALAPAAKLVHARFVGLVGRLAAEAKSSEEASA